MEDGMTEQPGSTVLVAPATVAAGYEGRTFDVGVGPLTVGKVIFEPEGVKGRRGYVSHRWTEEQLDAVRHVLDRAGHLDRVRFLTHVPADWRWNEELPRKGADG